MHALTIYSLGVTLYEALAGTTPFSGETADELIHAVLFADAPPLRRMNASVSRELEIVIHEALERTADRRYQSAAEFAEDLEAVLDLRPIRARPPTALERARRWIGRNKAITLSTASIALTLAIVLGVSLSRSAKQRADDEALARGNIERAGKILADHERRRTRLTESRWTMRKLRTHGDTAPADHDRTEAARAARSIHDHGIGRARHDVRGGRSSSQQCSKPRSPCCRPRCCVGCVLLPTLARRASSPRSTQRELLRGDSCVSRTRTARGSRRSKG